VLDARALAGYQRRTSDYSNPHGFPCDSNVRDASTVQTFALNAQAGAWLAFGDMIHARIEGRREVYEATHRIAYASETERSAIDAARNTVAAAVSNELLLADEAVSLVAGIRAELIRDVAATRTRAWTPLIPSLGLIWRARPWLGLKANIARTFRAPDFDELYLDMAGVRGEPGLEPERALTWDAGVRLGSERAAASAEVVWFQIWIEESIYFVARTAYLFEAANLGSGMSRGVEATFALHPHRRFDLRASYTWTDAWLDAMPAGTQLPGQPEHQAAARAEVELGGASAWSLLSDIPSLRLFAQANWRSRVYLDSFGNIFNPPFWSVDAGAAVAPLNWVEIALNVRNITDNRRGADSLQRPLPGRAFYVSLKVDFGEISIK
jgi:outer membrane receptor protein involved in Fe transport